jgi:glycerophosphoryl diester phosphodiesterase
LRNGGKGTIPYFYRKQNLMRYIIILVTFFLLQCSPSKKSTMQIPAFDRQGHRGCRGLMPENTIPAMLRAIELGVTTLEMDVVITADGQVILSHEPFMSWEISTTPDGRTFTAKEEKQYNIYRMDYATVRTWDVGLKPHPRFKQQEKLAVSKPLLSELIDSVESYAGRKGITALFYNIETKSDPAGDDMYHPQPGPFAEKLMSVIREKGIGSRVIIQSFDRRTLQVMHQKYPGIRTALLIEGFSKETLDEHLEKLGFTPSIYSPEFSLVNPALVSACHAMGMKLVPWTVNDKSNIDRLRSMGVDGIISDFPNLFTP